jgi:hypothetical protein
MPHHPTMPVIRFLPTLVISALLPLLAWAQGPGLPQVPGTDQTKGAETKKEEPPTEAELLLDAAINKVKEIEYVEATIRQDVSMLGQKFSVVGSYLKGPGLRVRMELNLKNLADAEGTMLQVCDGETLYDFQRIASAQNYRKLGIGKIMEAVDAANFEPEVREQIVRQFGFHGPEALLVGLRKAVLFDQKEEDTLDDKPVWVLRGNWKDRAALAPAGQAAPTGPLPPYVPSIVALTIGQEDGWPYRVEMKGRVRVGPGAGMAKKAETKPQVQAPRQDQVSSIVLTYQNVKLNTEIGRERFAFSVPDSRLAPNVQGVDQTEDWLTRIKELSIQLSQQGRKTEDTKGDNGALGQPIPVPKAPETPSSKSGIPSRGPQ